MGAKFENDKVLIDRFCQVMAGIIGVNREIRKNVEYAVFPYGYQGEIANKILQQKFGITPKYIVDEKWSKFNSNIISLETLTMLDNENLVVFIASDKNNIYDEIRKEINESITKGTVIDLFPMVNEDNDKKIESVRLLAKYFNSINLQGSVAEAGVRDGGFAQYINKYFPSKKLYLFDTFEGFKNERVKKNMIAEEKVFEADMDYGEYYHELQGGVLFLCLIQRILS